MARSSPLNAGGSRSASSASSAVGVGEGDLVLVEIAERDDARQDGGVAGKRVEEHLAREAAGAPRRQIKR